MIVEKYSNARFARGFLITDQPIHQSEIPNDWEVQTYKQYFIYYSKTTHFHMYCGKAYSLLLLGHAYNPYSGEFREELLLASIADYDCISKITDLVNAWTGLFTLVIIYPDKICFLGDCACMQAAYYGAINGHFFLSSYAQLIGDLCELKKSRYVTQMMRYKFWHMYGLSLPGDCSQFDEVKRLVPNTYVTYSFGSFSVVRFFPVKAIKMVASEAEYCKTIDAISALLHENLRLIAMKWKHPAISMTGGMDSKTTVACANGLYDKYKFYSYVSMDGDQPDAEAAKKIAEAIGVNHTTYLIPLQDSAFDSLEILREIIEHNIGDIGRINANDVRKRAFFYETEEFDVEVKSWISEIGRANYYKKFGLRKMPQQLSPRDMTTMYKFFSYNRILARKTDKIFKEYIEKTHFYDIFNYDSSDMYLWEFRYGAWGGLTITGEQRTSYDITIPFNNRLLMNEFLRLPLSKRIADIPHYDVIKKANRKIDDLGLTVTNWNETKKRMYAEKVYWYMNRLGFFV